MWELDFLENFDENLDPRWIKLSYSENLDIASNPKVKYQERIIALSRHWKDNEDYLLELSNKSPNSWVVSYLFDYSSIFTPIEKQAWSSIRSHGTIPFYPQYPVGGFIVDFANPHFKIIVELDGAEFHNEEKDTERDIKLSDLGWSVFRITGKEMNQITEYSLDDLIRMESIDNSGYPDFFELSAQYLSTGDGFFYALKQLFANRLDHGFYDEPIRNEIIKAITSKNTFGNVINLNLLN